MLHHLTMSILEHTPGGILLFYITRYSLLIFMCQYSTKYNKLTWTLNYNNTYNLIHEIVLRRLKYIFHRGIITIHTGGGPYIFCGFEIELTRDI